MAQQISTDAVLDAVKLLATLPIHSINYLINDYRKIQHEKQYPLGFYANPILQQELDRQLSYRPVPLSPEIDPAAWTAAGRMAWEGRLTDRLGHPLETIPLSPLKPAVEPVVTPIIPITPLNQEGFDNQNFDPREPHIIISNPIRGPPGHPSSRRFGNAAMPYNTQGFTARSQR